MRFVAEAVEMNLTEEQATQILKFMKQEDTQSIRYKTFRPLKEELQSLIPAAAVSIESIGFEKHAFRSFFGVTFFFF